MTSLDVPERQVAIDFFDDPHFRWHVRLLMINCGGGKWIWATPDLEVQYGDLTAHRIVAIPRDSPFPTRLHGELYAFDPLADVQLEQIRSEAVALAEVLGVKVQAGTSAGAGPRWVVADPAHESFGTPVDLAIVGDDGRFVNRSAAGLAQLSVGGSWVLCESVLERDQQSWLDEKHSGPGRDLRVCPIRRVGVEGPKRQTLDEAIAAHRPTEFKDWPFRGPRSVVELFDGVRASGLGFDAYVNHYVSVSGVAEGGAAARELRHLFGVLRHMSEYDQADCSNMASAELVSRRILMVQKAIRRSPKHPDYSGLDSMMASTLDETGGIVTSRFDEWVAQEQKTAAVIMKNQRQFVEERDAESRRQDGGDKTGGGGGKNK